MKVRIGLAALHLTVERPIERGAGEYRQEYIRETERVRHVHGHLQRVVPALVMQRHPVQVLIRIVRAALMHKRQLRTQRPAFVRAQRDIRHARHAKAETGARLGTVVHLLDQRRIRPTGTHAESHLRPCGQERHTGDTQQQDLSHNRFIRLPFL